jgi:hypothetical protein
LTVFSEWAKCEKFSVFKAFHRFCAPLVEQETTSTRNWRDTTFATPRFCKLKVENGKLKVNFVVVEGAFLWE